MHGYSIQVNAPLAAISQTSSLTHFLSLSFVEKVNCCFPKAWVESRFILSLYTFSSSPDSKIQRERPINFYFDFGTTISIQLIVSPEPFPFTEKAGSKTSPVETKNLPFSITSRIGCHPSSKLGSSSSCR